MSILSALGRLIAHPAAAAAPAASQPTTFRRDLTEADFVSAAARLGCDVAAVKALAEVESAGSGFLEDGRPKILFEAHHFGRLTAHRFDGARDPNGRAISVKVRDRKLYVGGEGEWVRMRAAERLNRNAARMACSWGAFQVMGFNHKACGFDTVEGFVKSMEAGAQGQLEVCVRFCLANGLDRHLRTRNWAAVARGYNGPAYAENSYDTKLAAAYRKHGGR